MVTAAKTTSQICLHMGVAFGLMYVMTGSVAIGGVAAVVEPICNVALLPLHDKVWARIRAKVEARQAVSNVATAGQPNSAVAPTVG